MEGKLIHLRATQRWRSQSSSLCWTTWCLRSSHTSEWHHISPVHVCGEKNTQTSSALTVSFSHSVHLAGSSLDKAGWKMTKTRRRRTSWEPQSTSMMYVPINKPLIAHNSASVTFIDWQTQLRVNHWLLFFLCKISNLIATEILRCEDVVTRVQMGNLRFLSPVCWSGKAPKHHTELTVA